jgi:hypothetical protein
MAAIKIASTGTEPELVDRVRIARASRPGQERVVVMRHNRCS